MYYYIFEPPREAGEYERTAHIKEYLSTLGIAGEMTSPTPARNIEDLVDLAVAKRYSTIVAVGRIELINQVVRAMEPHDAVLGIIPLMQDPDLAKLIGITDWKDAAQQLKRRRWQSVHLGLINSEACFLTPATLALPPTVSFEMETAHFTAQGNGGLITMVPSFGEEESESGISIRMETEASSSGGFFQSLFGKKKEVPSTSQFFVKEMNLITSQSIPVVVAGGTVTTSPLHCTIQDKPIKLIVGKAG